MSIPNFKEEFEKFLDRFTSPTSDANSSNYTPLSYYEIMNAVHDVINSKLDSDIMEFNQSIVRTPAATIIMATPDAPDIPKNSIEKNNSNFTARKTTNDQLSTKDNLNDDTITDDSNGSGEEKKIDKKSSPSSLLRSETYVCENESGNVFNNKVLEEKDKFSQTVNGLPNDFSLSCFNVPQFYKKLNTLKDVANDIIKNIEEFETVPENTRPTRRLSVIDSFPGLGRPSMGARTIQRPKMVRRSMTAFSGTPTSSRLSPGNPELPNMAKTVLTSNIKNLTLSTVPAVRSASSGALTFAKKSPNSGRLSLALKPPMATPTRSVSSGALKLTKNYKSPVQGSRLSSLKPSKTPIMRSTRFVMPTVADDMVRPSKAAKFSHVQSTIPKIAPVLGKRKAAEF